MLFIFRVNIPDVFSLKDKKSETITKVVQKVLDESGQKPSKIWVEKGSVVYNRSMKSWLKDTNIQFYSTHNEGK